MATAQREGGLYYVNGQAVDSEGQKVAGAPTQAPDTDPVKQPGALAGPGSDPISRLADMLAGKIAPAAVSARASNAGEEEVTLPTLAELPDHLADLTSVEAVRALQDQDERKGAVSMYEARIAELSGE
jgi:hypothetical protein